MRSRFVSVYYRDQGGVMRKIEGIKCMISTKSYKSRTLIPVKVYTDSPLLGQQNIDLKKITWKEYLKENK